MKIFGIEIGNTKLPIPVVTEDSVAIAVHQDLSSTIRPELKGVAIPEEKKPSNIPSIAPRTLAYTQNKYTRGQFSPAEYDLEIIGRVEDTDSYVMQAHMKKAGLIFKEGYEFVGPNPKTVQYIKMRFAQIARATGIPTDELLKAIGSGLVKKSNVFLVKVRKESASGGRRRMIAGKNKELEPIAGYFIAPAETMEYDADEYGRVRRWRQIMPDGEERKFAPEDVIHFSWNRKEGMIFGTPVIVPVLDDIRALRKIEENIELLVYQHLFPLFHYKIGSDDMPAGLNELGQDEISVAQREIRLMPSEGGIVTSHRHEISLIGAENRSLRAEGYLEHFKKRVFSGLGVSAVDMGEGECYDEHTMTLTENGWKFHWQINHKEERIGTYNPRTRRIEFHLANHKYEAPYVGKMIHFKNSLIDIMVTPEHDMWVWHNHKHTWNKMKAKDIKAGKAGWKPMLLESAPYLTEGEAEPTERGINLASVAGFVTGAGTLVDGEIRLELKRGRQTRMVSELLSDLAIHFEVEKLNAYRVAICFSEPELIKFIGLATDRALIKHLIKMPLLERKAFARSYADALQTAPSTCGYHIYTADHKLKDIAQEVMLSAGYRFIVTKIEKDDFVGFRVACNIHDRNINRRRFNVATDIKEVDYGGIIYCYNVENHLFVTKRNGFVTIQGNTANRATSDNMSTNLVDSVKDLQRHIEAQFNDFILNELLLESTFGGDVLNLENRVYLKFKEIDLDHQIKKESHYADLFAKNVVPIYEARAGMGKEAFSIPTAEEIESDPNIAEKYPEWYGTFWKLIEEPKALIQAIDEPYTPAAKAAAASRSTSVTEQNRVDAGKEKVAAEEQMAKTAAKAKTQNKPAPKKKDSFLKAEFLNFEHDISIMIGGPEYSKDWIKQIAYMTETQMIDKLKSRASAAFISGYRSIDPTSSGLINANMRARQRIESRVNFYVHRLIDQTIQAIDRQKIDVLDKGDRIQKVKSVFDSLRYRVDFIEDVEIKKATNLGKIYAAEALGYTHYELVVSDSACDGCKMRAEQKYKISESLDLEDVPPLHANSKTEIKFYRMVQDD